ncbi:hypothetical protein G6F31_019980 [Rhizopus arrhizus]|nr:hypothetical protein G6F31_019980 [Rhizopus arrhizus]
MNVIRTPRIAMVAPRVCARLDRDEAIAPLIIRNTAPRPKKIGVERRVMLITLVNIPARRIGLPDFHQRVTHRST